MSNHCLFCLVDLLLRNSGGRYMRPNYVPFVVWSAANADGGVVVGLGTESCLRSAEILSVCIVCCFV